jgi:hypothetical protein
VDAKQAVLDAFWRVARRHGSPVVPADGAARERAWSKAAFDRSLPRADARGRIYMASTTMPGG